MQLDFSPSLGLPVVLTDGGRAEAGYKGTTSDCVCRAIAIATELPYQEVYDLIKAFSVNERRGKRKRGISSPRTGVYTTTTRRIMAHLGWEWVPTMGIGTGCKVHMRPGELPMGRLLVKLSKHICCVVDGVVHDTGDPCRNGTRCVYGYWRQP